jgi:Flp pilus assembly secretin CpaC
LDSAKPFFDIGVKVDVTPTVNTEDKITLRIEPELSRLGVPATVPQAGIEFPRIITRRITTEFNLESGRTVAIGGLTQTTDDEQVTKVPILGDVPIIGKYLFRHTSTQTVQDELVIFVTVGLAGAESLTEVAGVPTEGKLIHQHLARESIQAHQMKSGK